MNMNNNNKKNKEHKNTYKLPETTILEHLLAKAAKNGYCKSGEFLDKVLGIKVV
jgi:hypothetical protein